jgi:FkbH-like protein
MTSADVLKKFVDTRAAGEAPSYSEYVAAANALAELAPEETKLPPLRLAVLRNFTVEPLIPVLAGEIALAGFHPQLYVGDFDAVQENAMNPGSPLYAFDPDVIMLAQWLEALSPELTTRFLATPAPEVARAADRVREHLRSVAGALNRNTAAPVLVNNFPLPAEPTLGILDSQSTDHQTHAILKLNTDVLADAKELNDVSVVDFMRLFAVHGSINCVDERYWQIARAPLSQKALVPVGREYGKFFRALRGKTKKCLVLDCDNTLWGGIIGEDGMSGIKLGPTYPGSCFVALQQEVLNLHERGVILALCSKNDEADVMEVLREHPDMVLGERHFSARQINWDDKVANLRRIALDLNIGLDSLVFVDDSPFEVNYVREHLPEVAVIQLPPGAYASYRSVLTRSGYFESLAFTAEDRRKNAMYGEQRERKALEAASTSLEEYLAKLEIDVDVAVPPAEMDVSRVSQLTQKTNQFNLTTRRYGEGAVRAFIASDDSDVFSLKVRDRISDSGLVGVAVLTYRDGTATIDSFLLSCRVIGRGVEGSLLSVVVRHAVEERGCNRVVGTYVASTKNAMVAEFYPRHGFVALDQTPEGRTWEYRTDGRSRLEGPGWIRLRRGDLTHASR